MPGTDVNQLKRDTLALISTLEQLALEIQRISRPFDDQVSGLKRAVIELDEKRKVWEDFIKEKATEFHRSPEILEGLPLRVQSGPDIDREWLNDYFDRHPDSFLKDYVIIRPSIAFSPCARQPGIPFSTLQARWRHNQAIETAQELAADGYVAIDTETTDLIGSAQVVSIAVVGKEQDAFFYSLVKPTCPISPEAIHIHHITEDMVVDAPTLADVMPFIQPLVQGKRLTAYNAPFDRQRIEVSARARGIQPLQGEWTDSMRLYLKYADLPHEKLDLAAQALGLKPEASLHHALTDARLAYSIVDQIAKGEPFEIDVPQWDKRIPPDELPRYAQQRLPGLLAELDHLRAQKKAAEALVSAEVKSIEALKRKTVESPQEEYDALLARAKENVIAIGESVKGRTYQLLYSLRHTWDIEGILAYTHAHPGERFSSLVVDRIFERAKVELMI
jgi:DNA polymerase III epsilon subunit-like protein